MGGFLPSPSSTTGGTHEIPHFNPSLLISSFLIAPNQSIANDDLIEETTKKVTVQYKDKGVSTKAVTATRSPTMSVRNATNKDPNLNMGKRLGKKDGLSERICSYQALRFSKNNGPKLRSVIVYDDGASDGAAMSKAFNDFFIQDGQPHKQPHEIVSKVLGNSEWGNHATACALSLVQAYHRAPLVTVGGDGRVGNYSDGTSIDSRQVASVYRMLTDPRLYEQFNHPDIMSCSYGMDFYGDSESDLDEGGLWKHFWGIANTVVLQAAGNSGKDLYTYDFMVQESGNNMMKTYKNPKLRGRFIHAMAAEETINGPDMTSFSCYYSNPLIHTTIKDPEKVHYAQDHSIMAPGGTVPIPADPFDMDGDGRIYKKGLTTVWDGTSAATPIVAGAISRIANEFELSAQKAAAIVLDTADLVQVKKNSIKGPITVKNLNLGAAIEEAFRHDIRRLLDDPATDAAALMQDLKDNYFSSGNFDITTINAITDFAARANLLEVLSLGELNARNNKTMTQCAPQTFITTWFDEVVETPREGLYIERNTQDQRISKVIYAHDKAPVITSIMGQRKSDTQYTFTFDGVNFTALPQSISHKGIIPTTLSISSFSPKKVTATVDGNFRSDRAFSLVVPNYVMACAQNLSFQWDWNKIDTHQ